MKKLSIAEDITRSYTLPTWFYTDPDMYDLIKEKIFANSWQYAADLDQLHEQQNLFPFTFLPGSLEEPLVIARDQNGDCRALSNVCTHRGNILCNDPCKATRIRCGYHGRRFSLTGRCEAMPAFEDVPDFPGKSDHLPKIALTAFGPIFLSSLNPHYTEDQLFGPLQERMNWFPFDQLRYDANRSKTYLVKAHWALYVDNYLEGFHIPFVHPALNASLDISAYNYECLPQGVLQVGEASVNEPSFDLPDGHPDADRRIFGYYFWVFPNLMFNFYPWGLSFNWVQPLTPDRTRVVFRTYLLPGMEEAWEACQLDATELEDEAVVEQVQKGVRSRLYARGRFSPSQEPGVHHFHKLLARSVEQYL